MISMNKKYITRKGEGVYLYTVNAGSIYTVHGVIAGNFHPSSWCSDGACMVGTTSDRDLIEVEPTIYKELWINVYEDPECDPDFWSSKERADKVGVGRFACVKFIIDCKKGDGL